MMKREELIGASVQALDAYLKACHVATAEGRIEALSVLAMETSRLIGRIQQAAHKEQVRNARKTI